MGLERLLSDCAKVNLHKRMKVDAKINCLMILFLLQYKSLRKSFYANEQMLRNHFNDSFLSLLKCCGVIPKNEAVYCSGTLSIMSGFSLSMHSYRS
jgi:hypothetical protein